MEPTDRTRMWREKQEKSGNKMVTVAISIESHEFLKTEQADTKETFGQIINRGLQALQSDATDF